MTEFRSLAAAGEWSALCRSASARVSDLRSAPALITLYAEALLRTGEARSAQRLIDEHEAFLQTSGDRHAIRRAVNFLGAASFEQSDLARAALAFERALELGRVDGDDLLVARATNNLAVIATIHGRHDEALGLYAVALPTYQRLGNLNGLAESYHNAAIVLRKLQRLREADEHEQRAADFAREAQNNHLVALTLVGRAEICLLRGDAAQAEAWAVRAASALAKLPDPVRQADAIRLAGAAQFALAKLHDALESLDLAVQLSVANSNALIEAESRWVRAQVFMARGMTSHALDDAEAALTIFRRLDAPTEVATLSAWLAAQKRPPS